MLTTKQTDQCLQELSTQSWSIIDGVFSDSDWVALRHSFQKYESKLELGKVGIAQQPRLDTTIRNDHRLWLEESWIEFQPLYDGLALLGEELRRQLYLPTYHYEVQMALYPPGHFYLRHRDRHEKSSHRWVTVVIYLEPWNASDGGVLNLFLDSSSSLRVEPKERRMVCFLSEIEHEVSVSHFYRKSFTAWFRDERNQ